MDNLYTIIYKEVDKLYTEGKLSKVNYTWVYKMSKVQYSWWPLTNCI
jgi:hypothetical protein